MFMVVIGLTSEPNIPRWVRYYLNAIWLRSVMPDGVFSI